ncbi:MAG: hypothetical protein ACPL1F_00300 [bacterium]
MGKYLAIDYNLSCSGYIHNFLGADVWSKKTKNKNMETFNGYQVYWFCDNLPEDIYYVFYHYLKDRNKIIINSPMLRTWELKRNIGINKFKEIFSDLFYIPKYLYFKDLNNIEEVIKEVKDLEEGVIKSNTSLIKNTTYHYKNLEELKNILEMYKGEYQEGFLIQEYIKGKEVAISGFFLESQLILPVYVNYEFKRTINKNLGNNTGQSAEFGYFTYAEEPVKIIKKLEKYFLDNGIKYTGYVDINGILSEKGYSPLEWTISRDGHPTVLNMFIETDITVFLREKDLKIENPFRYNLVLRADDTELPKKQKIKFMLGKEKFKGNKYFIPEEDTKKIDEDDKYVYFENSDSDLLGYYIETSKEFKEIDINFNFGVNLIYYENFNKEVKERYIKEWFKWKK